eukprot:5331150-Pyramimonas_sp.AAC.1
MCESGACAPCGLCRWGLRWVSVWSHETSEGVPPNRVRVRHADCAAGVFGGAPYRATERMGLRNVCWGLLLSS